MLLSDSLKYDNSDVINANHMLQLVVSDYAIEFTIVSILIIQLVATVILKILENQRA
jgi:hypothetical protein